MKNKATKKSSNAAFWAAGGVFLVLLATIILLGRSSGVDYSAYQYSDQDASTGGAEIVVFSDFQCPYCAIMARVLDEVKKEYPVEVTYKHFPLPQFANSELAAEASECARDQGRFWAFHDVLFDHQNLATKKDLLAHAQGLLLDTERFERCLNTREKQVIIASHKAEGRKIGVSGTPSVYIDANKVSYSTKQEFISALKQPRED
jgi:protein-disulfide isomerase